VYNQLKRFFDIKGIHGVYTLPLKKNPQLDPFM